MKTPFRRADPLADAQAAVDRLEAQRRPLADRLTTADARVEAAQRARHEALLNGDPDEATTAKLDRACSDAIEARGGVEAALRAVAVQVGEAVEARDRLISAGKQKQVIAETERRAAELDAVGIALETAAEVFGEACSAMERAIAQHGVRADSPLFSRGLVPASVLARPVIMAAVRRASPSLFPAVDNFGARHADEPLVVLRRAQSGRLRDHADAVREGKAPVSEMPRPGEDAVPAHHDVPSAPEPMVMAVFSAPFSYLAGNGYQLISGEEGQAEVPARVAARGREMAVAFEPGSAEGRAIVARIMGGGASRVRPRVFIDTEVDADPALASAARPVTTTWPDERDTGRGT